MTFSMDLLKILFTTTFFILSFQFTSAEPPVKESVLPTSLTGINILDGDLSTKLNDLKPESSHHGIGYPFYGQQLGLNYGYPTTAAYTKPVLGYYPGYAAKPVVPSYTGYVHPPALGYNFGLGHGFGSAYPGGLGYNPVSSVGLGYTPNHHLGALPSVPHHGYPYFG